MRRIFLFLFSAMLFGAGPSISRAAAPWEVAVVFLGKDEPTEFQEDIDRNILELAKTEPGALLRLSILRDARARRVQAFFGGEHARKLSLWDPLFASAPLAGVKVPGTIVVQDAKSDLFEDKELAAFLSKAFRSATARRLLLIYGHGEGFRGLRGVPLRRLEMKLSEAVPSRSVGKALDVLWFDSCFMSSLEAFAQLKNLTSYFVASQDAEFSSGMPFDVLSELTEDGMENPAKAAVHLAYRHIESYSFVKKGSQVSAVDVSSATVAVVDADKLDALWEPLQKLAASIKGRDPGELDRMSARSRMEDASFVDLGKWLKDFRARDKSKEWRDAVARLNAVLETSRSMNIQKSPRIRLSAREPGARFIFGYENWSRGDETDADLLAKLPSPLKAQGFAAGPNGRQWPIRPVQKRLYLQPFLPGLDRFHVQWIDGQGRSAGTSDDYIRRRDFAYVTAKNQSNPILFSAHTWSAGTQSDRYTGLNIADPAQGLPTMDYLDNVLHQKTGWGDF